MGSEMCIRDSTSSESCIDNLDFMMKVENGVIKDIRFDGEACAISTSATSFMIRSLIGKKIEDVKKILINYQKMINEEEYDETVKAMEFDDGKVFEYFRAVYDSKAQTEFLQFIFFRDLKKRYNLPMNEEVFINTIDYNYEIFVHKPVSKEN